MRRYEAYDAGGEVAHFNPIGVVHLKAIEKDDTKKGNK